MADAGARAATTPVAELGYYMFVIVPCKQEEILIPREAALLYVAFAMNAPLTFAFSRNSPNPDHCNLDRHPA